MGQTTVFIPDRSGNCPAWPDDTPHLTHSFFRVWNEMQHKHRIGAIKRFVFEWKIAGITLLEAKAGIFVATFRKLDISFDQINANDGRDICKFRQDERQAAGAAAHVKHTFSVAQPSELDQLRGKAAAVYPRRRA